MPKFRSPGLPGRAERAGASRWQSATVSIGVLVAEDRDPMRFGEWHEAYLEIVGNQIALGIDRMLGRADEPGEAAKAPDAGLAGARLTGGAASRRLTFYRR